MYRVGRVVSSVQQTTPVRTSVHVRQVFLLQTDTLLVLPPFFPFADRKVLEKYCKVRNHRNLIGSKPDEFYDEIKIRVAATLKEKGIDPIEDRGASTWRIAYYVVIFAAFLWTGYAHVMVRSSVIFGT